jgi:formiminoglutamase
MLSSCLQPLDPALAALAATPHSVAASMRLHLQGFPDLSGVQLALVGLPTATSDIRTQLFGLKWRFGNLVMADLGNLKPASDRNATLQGLSEVLAELHEKGIVCIVLGDEADTLWAQYMAYRHVSAPLSMALVLAGLDLQNDNSVHRILEHQPSHLFNLNLLATQACYMPQPTVDMLERGHHEHHRLGELRGRMEEAEPMLRSALSFAFSMEAVRASDAPATVCNSPNGLYAEEAATLARYAGLSPTLSSFMLYDCPKHPLSAMLAAQLIWYFTEGFAQRYHEWPDGDDPEFIVYRITLRTAGYEIVFYRSKRSNRWWMDVPHPYEAHNLLLGCSYNDYQSACNDELPERWWRAYQRLL